MKSCILFDWDGTLVDNFSVIKGGLNAVFTHFDMPLWDDETAKRNIRLTAKDLFAKTFHAAEDQSKALEIYLGHVERNHLAEISIISGAAAFLESLHAIDGLKLGIVSNKTQRFLDAEIAHLGWQDYFVIQIGAGTASKDKPHPDSILLALERIGKNAAETRYIGDTHTDMLAAYNAGVEPVFVTYGLGGVHDLGSDVLGGTLPKIIDTYPDLLDFLTR